MQKEMAETPQLVPVRCCGSGRSWPGIGWFNRGETRDVPADLRMIMVRTGYFEIPEAPKRPKQKEE